MTTAMQPLRPGRPGRGPDRSAAWTDLQWYMYHQRNVVHFAAFSANDYDFPRVVRFARELIRLAPQFNQHYWDAEEPPREDVLARICRLETVESFDDFPDAWLNDGQAFEQDDLPLFRVRIARLERPDAEGRRSFMLVQVSHVLAEGTDSSLLLRSKSAAHAEVRASNRTPGLVAFAARAFAFLAIPGHLLVSRLVTPHPGKIVARSFALSRARIAATSRRLGIRQRALCIALVAHAICKAGTPAAKRRLSTTYSVVDDQGGQNRDSFMRMRLRFAVLENRDDFSAYAQAVDAQLTRTEAKESGFNAEMNSAATRYHRRVAKVLPFLYGPKLFAFMPYDFVFALIPPHRLRGAFVDGLVEPVYCGATMPGINGAVVVTGRQWVTFNFYVEEKLLPQLDGLEALLDSEPGHGYVAAETRDALT